MGVEGSRTAKQRRVQQRARVPGVGSVKAQETHLLRQQLAAYPFIQLSWFSDHIPLGACPKPAPTHPRPRKGLPLVTAGVTSVADALTSSLCVLEVSYVCSSHDGRLSYCCFSHCASYLIRLEVHSPALQEAKPLSSPLASLPFLSALLLPSFLLPQPECKPSGGFPPFSASHPLKVLSPSCGYDLLL